ncbi:MAG TPA: carboxypeptidase-like regulatory domain-containing protein [Bryocella sp.]|nr:carboxypeptidase-like regulatory domain-containing protein [Bryocella sp.]
MTLSYPRKRWLSAVLQLFALVLFVLAVPSLNAQVAGTGTIQGVVTDPSGAVVPGATVTLTEESTRVVHTAKTDSAGAYVFPNIVIGTYTVTVADAGFQTYSKIHNVLEVGSNIAIEAHLALGKEEQTVTVEAEGLALQTEDAKFKQTVDEQQIAELPLNSASRQVTGLISLAGGATPAPGGDFTGSKYSYQVISISIAGGQGNTTIWRLDGGDNNDYMTNVNYPFPFPDALNQFSVETTVLGAQDGIHSGGLVNAVTRSGTNHFHGNAFDFIRNNYINARNFYSAVPDSLHQNQFGGTFGGPIKRDKLFAFAGYQRLMAQQSSNPTTVHLPTAANLLGDFSVTDPVSGTNACRSAIQLKDPLTGNPIPGNKYATTPTWNASALAIYKLLPKPTDEACGTYVYTVPTITRDNQFVTRVDWSISSKHNFFGRYFIDGYQQPAVYNPANILVTTQSGNLERFQSLTFGENWTVSSRTVNSAHITFSRIKNNRGYASNVPNATAFGINVYQYSPAGLYYTVTNKFTTGCGTCIAAVINDNAFNATDELTLLRGHHSIVVGGEFVRNQLNFRSGFNSNGNFATNGEYSGSGPNGGSTLGDADLDFLFGLQSSFQQSPQQQEALRGNIPSLYVQDTWHTTPRLTVVAGVRWSPDFFPVDYFNRGSVFSMSAFTSGQKSIVFPSAPAGSLFYGDPGVGRNFTGSSPWLFSPNVGFSFDPIGNGKTVIRGGYELIYDEPNFYTGQRDQQNPPFAPNISQTQTSTSGPISLTNPWSTGTVTSSPFPQPPRSATTVSFFPQTQWVVLPSKVRPAYSSQYTMSVQHSFAHGYQVQVDYIGSDTFRMPLGVPLNPVNFVPGVWGAGGTGCAGVVQTGPAAAKPGAAGSNCSTTANSISRATLTQLNPVQGNFYAVGGTGSASTQILNEGMANYNGVIVSVQHRLSGNFSLLTNYTYSKCLDIVDAQGDIAATSVSQPFNLRADYGPCGSDYRHIFNTAVVAGTHFHMQNHLIAAVVNGWQIAPLVHVTSGAPVNVTTGTDVSLTSVGNDRPNRVPGVPVYLNQKLYSGTSQALRGYLNPLAFCPSTLNPGCPTSPSNLPAGAFGTVGRNAFRARNYIQTDASLSRFFPVHEAMTLQLRLEAFNVLNHPYFSTPTASTSSSTFGQIGSTTGEGPRIFQGAFKFNF